ncbi:MAG: proline--tRNA ligase [Candidatus Hinthialibacter antarcticus]|nr:proline--tRNA ligase [Candidatus Hinthialibacter antarcticus]
MKQSSGFFPTLREAPKEAEAKSHILMLRAGLVRQLAAGLYIYLPMGWRALRKIEQIVREEMDAAGAIEVLMPSMQPDTLWKDSGRFELMGPEMMRLRDRNEREFVLGPTHEEVVTNLAANEIQSYRDLPKNLYQIQTKFRDEIRPRFGIVRAREFIMKDAYSFDCDDAGAEKSYKAMYDAYANIFHRCGLTAVPVEADTGVMGGSHSHEFMVPADIGESEIVSCSDCDYRANRELTECATPDAVSDDGAPAMEEVHTPEQRTIEDVSAFLKTTPDKMIKTMIFTSEDGPFVVLLRGDHTVNEIKVAKAIGKQVELAEPEIIQKVTGAPVGFAGPAGLKGVKIYADYSVRSIGAGTTGANKGDYHLQNVVLDRDYKVDHWVDLRLANPDDVCPKCSQGKLSMAMGIEVGHVFILGTKYSEALHAQFTDEDGSRKPMVMGCYGIGVSRTLAAVLEENADDNGIVWPVSTAPFHVHILNLSPKSETVTQAANDLEQQLTQAGFEVLVDDRNERPGVKFKDSDLMGLPYRIVVGEKSLANGQVEFVQRSVLEKELIAPDQAVAHIQTLYNQEMERLRP